MLVISSPYHIYREPARNPQLQSLQQYASLSSDEEVTITCCTNGRSELLGKDLRQLSMSKVQRGGMWLILVQALVSRPLHFLAGGFVMVSHM